MVALLHSLPLLSTFDEDLKEGNSLFKLGIEDNLKANGLGSVMTRTASQRDEHAAAY